MARRPRFKQIEAPQLPAYSELQQLTSLTLEPSAIYEDLVLESLDLTEQQAQAIVLERVRILTSDFSSTQLPSLYLKDAEIVDCTALNADWTKAQIERTVFANCRLSALQLSQARLENVVFYQCQLDYSVWWELQARKVHFEQCRFVEASFEGADLRGVVFRDCELKQVDFRRAKLKATDLRGSAFQAAQFRPQDLRGLIVDPPQALDLVAMLGIIVQTREDLDV